jgi:hypothetical protein
LTSETLISATDNAARRTLVSESAALTLIQLLAPRRIIEKRRGTAINIA